jgi:hypothetical protein
LAAEGEEAVPALWCFQQRDILATMLLNSAASAAAAAAAAAGAGAGGEAAGEAAADAALQLQGGDVSGAAAGLGLGLAEALLANSSWLESTKGRCLNASASALLTASGAIKYSRTHNVYRGEIPMLDALDRWLEQGLGLGSAHGGKWQITTYV